MACPSLFLCSPGIERWEDEIERGLTAIFGSLSPHILSESDSDGEIGL